MKKIILPNKEFQKMPYSGTTTAWTKTKGEVEGILYDLRSKGILKEHAWHTKGETEDLIETLYMTLELPISDTQIRTVHLKFQPVMIYTEHWTGSIARGDKRLKKKIQRDVSWRLFWWHFKSKMEAVQYGLVTLEEEFMSNIILPLEHQEVTFGEALKSLLETDRLKNFVLEDKRERVPVEATHI